MYIDNIYAAHFKFGIFAKQIEYTPHLIAANRWHSLKTITKHNANLSVLRPPKKRAKQ